MSRMFLRGAIIAVVFLLIGIATAAAVLAYLPNPGSAPSIFDDFNFSSTANGFWHVNAIGASALIHDGKLNLTGHSVELDRRVQTDPYQTIVVTKVRGLSWDKFAFGLGVYHAGTVSVEFDRDGIKCGRPTDFGWKIEYVKGWTTPPTGKWFYLTISVTNPYPSVTTLTPEMKKPITLVCSAYDSQGHMLGSVRPTQPETNAHYAAFDEAYLRTWDSQNNYQVDWIYAGPPSGSPVKGLLH